MSELHKLLKRQLKRYKVDEQTVQDHESLFSAISSAYLSHDQEMSLLERSLFVTSNELNERNTLLSTQVKQLSDIKDQLEQSNSALTATFDATGEHVVVYSVDGNLVSINSMGRAFFEKQGVDDYRHWSAFLMVLKNPNKATEIKHKLDKNPDCYIEGTLEATNNRYYEYRSLPQTIDKKIVGRVWCFRDITHQREQSELIQRQAYHDALTGLPNRSLLIDRARHAIALAKRLKKQVAVLFIDLDNFKRVNDSEGHKAGDELLIKLVGRIRSRLREQDTFARLGGDEFVIIVEELSGPKDVESLCDQLLSILKRPFEFYGRPYYVSQSIGISLFPDDGNDADELILKADMAMYQAKDLGKNNYQFYHSSLEKEAQLQVKIEQELREALKTNELQPYFQPKINVQSGRISGAEILMRWFKPDGTSVPPDIFIPVAESTGLISKIGKKALLVAMEQLKYWQEQGVTHLKFAVNLSIIEFQDVDVIQFIIDKLDELDVPGSGLIIEVTESIFMENKDNISRTMDLLRTRGISFALDDFGKGYSSFSYLQSLPIDYLKIDKTFLQGVTHDKQSAAITRTIIDIGHNLELDVVAEGIEDQETLNYVKSEQCNTAQGYFLYKPMPSESFIDVIEEGQD